MTVAQRIKELWEKKMKDSEYAKQESKHVDNCRKNCSQKISSPQSFNTREKSLKE